MAAPIFANPPTPHDWQYIQVQVRKLYVKDKLPLKEVRSVLRDQHGFKATERMIKARLKQWGYLKNAKKEDWHYLAIIFQQRRLQGKTSTEFIVRGHRKTVKDLQRFIRNQNMTTEEFLTEAQQRVRGEPVPAYIRASTPDSKQCVSPGSFPLEYSTPSPQQDSRQFTNESFSVGSALFQGHHFRQPTNHQRHRSRSASSNEMDTSPNSNINLMTAPSDFQHSARASTSPAASCQQLQWDIEAMSRQMTSPIPLKQKVGEEDIRSWALITNSPQSEGSDKSSIATDFVCSRCNQPSQEHFISLDAFEPRSHARRDILNGDDHTLHLPVSTDGEGPWTWVSRCFLASMCLTRGNQEAADMALTQASREFERLLDNKDIHLLTAALLVVTILHMHNQGAIAKRVMQSAAGVAARILQETNPIRATIEYFTHCANLNYSQTSSEIVKRSFDAFASILPRTHPYVITSQYNYMFMLKFEDKLDQAESVARDCYATSCRVFGKDHMQSIVAQASLAGCLFTNKSRRDECISLYDQVIARSRNTLGLSHPYTLEATRRMAMKIEERDGVTPQTAELFKSVLTGRVRMLGRTHSFTIGARADYETRLKRLEKWEDEHGLPSDERNEIEDLFSLHNPHIWTRMSHKRQWSSGSHEAGLLDVEGGWLEAAVESDEDGWDEEVRRIGSPASSAEYQAY